MPLMTGGEALVCSLQTEGMRVVFGPELHDPDFARLEGPRGVGPALKEALTNTRLTVSDVPVGRMPSPWTGRPRS